MPDSSAHRQSGDGSTARRGSVVAGNMDRLESKDEVSSARADQTADAANDQKVEQAPSVPAEPVATAPAVEAAADQTKPQKKKQKQKTVPAKQKQKQKISGKKNIAAKKKHKKKLEVVESSADDSDSDDDSSSSSSDESDAVANRKKRKAAAKAKKLKSKLKKLRKQKKDASSSEATASESEDSSSDGEPTKKKKGHKVKIRRSGSKSDSKDDSESDSAEVDLDLLETQLTQMMNAVTELKKKTLKRRTSSSSHSSRSRTRSSSSKKSSKGNALKFQRVDQVWDVKQHRHTLKESVEDDDSEFAEFAFLVRRKFDYDNKLRGTDIDVKSKPLVLALREVLKECKAVNLSCEEPVVDPNILFLYLEQLRTYYKQTLKAQIKKAKKKKAIKKLSQQRAVVKLLVAYIDEDYEATKKTLYPLLEAGMITFELLWALFKPNEVVLTSSYGHWGEPRCFSVEHASFISSMTRGDYYLIEGRYIDYDGKSFGYGAFEGDVAAFKGPRKITSLPLYPLRCHRDAAGMRAALIARGRAFAALDGMQYKYHQGIAFVKKKKQVLKININGRVMIDPALFRRINPNYAVCTIRPSEDLLSESEDGSDCGCADSDEEVLESDDELSAMESAGEDVDADQEQRRTKYRRVRTESGDEYLTEVEVDEDGNPVRDEALDALAPVKPELTDDQLLLTSPVVLGFAFGEKLWLEFSLTGLRAIEYNDTAFDSLVLPPDQKKTIHALVNSHKFHGARAIDDVIQGKGKGLVAVLHGPPGTGKTLTAEGISELLRCPLYCVSAGELGTDPARLELDLQRILDVAHSWGAVLLLDEADVFLERREPHDIHRNALVSIFLRLLEYFQGILFLTTNRVETFDDAFQSRIHVALKYGALTTKARRTVWRMFLDMVVDASAPDAKAQESSDKNNRAAPESQQSSDQTKDKPALAAPVFTDADLDALARKPLNGRQIKNLVRTAQAMALNEGAVLAMDHIWRVIDVAESFDRDLKGGSGYQDAMRSYT